MTRRDRRSVGVFGTSSIQWLSAAQPDVAATTRAWSSARARTSNMVNLLRCRTTRTSGHPGGAPVQSARARPSRCRRPVRPRWSRFTWPARACLNGECDMALAGGVVAAGPAPASATGTNRVDGVGRLGTAGRSTSASDGTIFGSGVGVVVLKPLQDGRRRRRPHPRGDPGFGAQQRRVDEDELRGAQRRGQAEVIAEAHAVAGHRRVDGQLRRDARDRHPAGRPDRNRRAAPGIRHLHRDQAGPVLRRVGQVQHRSPRDGRRNRRPDQDHPVPQTPGDPGDPALHAAPTPNCTSTGARSQCAARTARGNGTVSAGPASARSGLAVPTLTSYSRRRPRYRRRKSGPRRRCCCCRRERPRRSGVAGRAGRRHVRRGRDQPARCRVHPDAAQEGTHPDGRGGR